MASCSRILALLIILSIGLSCLFVTSNGEFRTPPSSGVAFLQARASSDESPSTSVTVYKEPNGWIVRILRELFDDIDWRAIELARLQIVKFIHKVERILGSFSSTMNKATSGANSGGEQVSTRDRRTLAGRWWGGSSKAQPSVASDATSVKEMLERVACFVGYMRLMNLSNEALAELDAAKVVTNLFGSVRRNSTSWSNWFG